MSTVRNVEENVVKMTFDNKDFDKNVKESEKTVSGFGSALNELKNTVVQVPADLMNGLSRVLQSVNIGDIIGVGAVLGGVALIKNSISGIGDTIESVAHKALSTINGVMASAINQIKTGGRARAENIQQAKFMIEGLELDVETFMEAANYAVADTAYGLDAAAKAAAQFGASGVTASEKLKYSLRAISGVASMTNSSYEEIAHIFTTIAGNGRLMTEQLNSLSIKGLNVASILAKSLNKTEAEIRGMVSDSQISFDMFAKAMDDAFGAHAKEANKTFSGVMSNIRAALNKIGEGFYTPLISDTLGFLDQLRIALNAFKTALADNHVFSSFSDAVKSVSGDLENMLKIITDVIKESPIIESLSYLIGDVFKTIADVFSALSFDYAIDLTEMTNGMVILIDKIKQIFWAAREAYDSVFGITHTGANLRVVWDLIGKIMQKFDVIDDREIKSVFESWLTVLKNVLTTVKDIFGINKGNIETLFGDLINGAFEFFKKLKLSDDEIDNITRTVQGLLSVIDIVKMLVVQIFEFIKPLGGYIRPLMDSILSETADIGDWFKGLRDTIKEDKVFENFFKKIRNIIVAIMGAGNAAEEEASKQDGLFPKIIAFFKSIIGFISSFFKEEEETYDAFNRRANWEAEQKDAKGSIFSRIFEYIGALVSGIGKIGDFLFGTSEGTNVSIFEKVLEWFSNIVNFVKKFFVEEETYDAFNRRANWEAEHPENNTTTKKGGIFSKIVAHVSNFLSSIKDGIKILFDSLSSMDTEKFIAITVLITIIIDEVRKLLQTLIIFATLPGMIFTFMQKVKEIVREINPVATVKSAVVSSFTKLQNMVEAFTLSQAFHTLPSLVTAFANGVRDIVLAVTGALLVTSLIPADRLKSSVIAFAAMMGVITLFLGALLLFTKLFPDLKETTEKSRITDSLGITRTDNSQKSNGNRRYNESMSSRSKNPLLKFAVLIEAIALAMLQISTALLLVSLIGDPKQMAASVITLAVAMIGIAVTLFGMMEALDHSNKINAADLVAISIVFTVMSAAMIAISASLVLLAKGASPGEAALAAVIMAVLLAAIAGIIAGLSLLTQKDPASSIIAGTAVLLACVGLFTVMRGIVKVLKEVNKMDDIDKVEKTLKGIMGIIIAVGAVVTIALAVGGAIGSIGGQALIGMAIVAAALLEFVLILNQAALMVSSISGAIKAWAEAIKAIKEMIDMAKDMTDEQAANIGARLEKIFKGIFKGIIKGIFSFNEANTEALSEFIPNLIAFLSDVILPALSVVFTKIIPEIWNEFIKLIETVATLIAKTPMEKIDPIKDFLLMVLDDLLGFIFEALGILLYNINEYIPMLESKIFMIVMNIIETFNRLMEMNQDAVQKELTQLINNLILFAATAMLADQNVEVIWTTASAIIDTLVYGIAQSAVKLGEAMQKLARFAIASFFLEWNTFGLFDSEWLFDEMFDADDFKITPTLDLSQIQAGKDQLNEIMASNSSYQYDGVFSANNSPYTKSTQAQLNTDSLKGGIEALRTEFGNIMKEQKTSLDLNFTSDAYGQLQVLNQEDFIMSGAGWN